MKIILCVLALLCLFFSATSQLKAPPQLLVGDKVPEFVLGNLLNSEAEIIKISPENEKLLILEFISTTCGTCIKSVEHLHQLQEHFEEDIKIILITTQSKETIKEVIKRHNWKLPVAVENTIAGMMFPHLSVPHQVWLYNGEVKAITSWRYANKENIQKLLSGQEVLTYLKEEDTIDISKPIMRAVAGMEPLYQSVITPAINNGSSGYQRKDNSLLIYNSSIAGLYKEAFEIPSFPLWSYIIAEVNDSIRHILFGPQKSISGHYEQDQEVLQWEEKHTYCYNLVFPRGSDVPVSEFKRIMRNDLNSFFSQNLGIKGEMEERVVRCLALSKIPGDKLPLTAGGNPEVIANAHEYILRNKPINLLVLNLSNWHYKMDMPIINNTGFTGNIDISIPGGLDNLDAVNVQLKSYGLQLIEKELPLKMLVLKEIIKNTESTTHQYK